MRLAHSFLRRWVTLPHPDRATSEKTYDVRAPRQTGRAAELVAKPRRGDEVDSSSSHESPEASGRAAASCYRIEAGTFAFNVEEQRTSAGRTEHALHRN